MARAKARLRLTELQQDRNRRNPLAFAADPVGFVRSVLQEHVWSKQAEILESVRDNRRTAVQSCHDSGKSFIAARAAAWWLSTKPVGEAMVITSAPTNEQVRGILWREINRAHARGNLPGRVNATEWIIGKEMVALGRKPADTNMTGFQGFHAPYVLVIFDEACGMPTTLWDGAESLLTNEDSHILAIGNPDDPQSNFEKVCRPGSGWNVIQIPVDVTPNFTGEVVPDHVRKVLVSKTWVKDALKNWGEDSPQYIAKVTATFPGQAKNALFKVTWVREAVTRELEPYGDVELGVDVAREGDDETVIYVRHGPKAWMYGYYAKQDLMETVGRIVQAIRDTGAKHVKIDDVGLGGGVTDRLKELRREKRIAAEIYPVNVAEKPIETKDQELFLNRRDQLWWALADRFREGLIDLKADDDTEAQLTAIRTKPDSRGRQRVESKEEMKKPPRSLKSPDRADALVLAFAPNIRKGEGVLDFYRQRFQEMQAAEAARQMANP